MTTVNKPKLNFDPLEMETVSNWCSFNEDSEYDSYIDSTVAWWLRPTGLPDIEFEQAIKYLALGCYLFHKFYDDGLEPPAWIHRWYMKNSELAADDTVVIDDE